MYRPMQEMQNDSYPLGNGHRPFQFPLVRIDEEWIQIQDTSLECWSPVNPQHSALCIWMDNGFSTNTERSRQRSS